MTLACTDTTFAYIPSRPVLEHINVSIAPTRITALVGPNGAGKSTLLRLMAGLLAPSSGRVTLASAPSDPRPVAGMHPADRARHIAYVAQRASIAFAFSARQVVSMGRHALPRSDDAVGDALDALDLAPIADRPFNTLSAGQQQRVAIARAVAQLAGADSASPSPRYLLADEPLAALDPRHIIQSLGLFRSLAASRGIGVVLVLHDLTAARRIADHAILLNCGGTLGASGPASEVLTPEILGPAYGVAFESVPLSAGPPALIPMAALSSQRR